VGQFVFVFHGTPHVVKFRVAQPPLFAAVKENEAGLGASGLQAQCSRASNL
jgi:hypothetical protein